MADKKISDLNAITGANTADDDLFVIVDSSTNETKKIRRDELSTAITADITDGAPATLDTLNELAAALNDDANFSTTVTNSIAAKVSKSGDSMTGNLSVTGTVTATSFSGDITGDVTGDVTGTVSDVSNHDTDDISEGSSNLYFTNERVDDRVDSLLTAGTNITLTYNDSAGTLTIDATDTDTGILSVSEDTSPTLGGNLNASNANINNVNQLEIQDRITHDGDNDTYIDFDTNKVRVFAGNEETINLNNSGVVINDGGIDRNTVIRGSTEDNLLYVDAGEDRIGIGTNTPSVELDVVGSVNISGSLDVTDAATTRTNINVDEAGTALALSIALG